MPSRPLSPLEIPYVVTNTTSSGTFVLQGPVDAVRLATAYAALRREFPVLAGRIVATPNGFDVVTDDPGVEHTAPLHREQRAFVPGDVRLGLQPETELSAVALISDGDKHQATIGVNHAIADGGHALFLLLRLWELYTDPDAEIAPAQELPLGPLDLAGRLGAVTPPSDPEVVDVVSAGVVPTVDDVDAGDFGFTRIVFDAAQTAAVRAQAKAVGLSFHGLLVGVIVAAERAEIDAPLEAAVPMAVFSPVDLRWRCDPPVAPASVTNFAGSSTAPLRVTGDADPVEIGRAVLARLRADLADGTVAAALTGSTAVTVTGGAPVRLSNVGGIPVPATPPELAAVDFYSSSEVDIDRVRGFVRIAPPEALGALIGMHYHAFTFDGRLSIEMRWAPGTLTTAAVERISSRIEQGLLQAVGTPA